MQSGLYEFTPTQNKLIHDLAVKMRFVSYFLIAFGVLLLIGGIISVRAGEIAGIVNGIVQIIMGFLTHKASTYFARIVGTQGRDMENLMVALDQLRQLYTLLYGVILIAIVAIAIALAIALLF